MTRTRTREAYVTGEPMLNAFRKTFMAMSGSALQDKIKMAEYRKTCADQVGHRAGPSEFFDHSIDSLGRLIALSGFKKIPRCCTENPCLPKL